MSGYDGRGGKFDIIAVRGADMAFTVTATDSASAAIDLSAATIDGELYNADGSVADTMTDVVSGAGSNIITLSFTDAEMTALTGESYPWTLWVTRGGDKRPWLAGRFRVVDSSNGVRSTDGDAVTLTVDSDVNVSISVLAVGGSGGGASTLEELSDVTIATPVNGNVLTYADGDWVNDTPAGGGDLLAANNLSDVASATTARTNLGLAIGTNVQAYSSVLAATTASFTTADETKLDGIEALADVTDTANVTAAGALMDSEVDADIKTLSLPANTTISAFGATLVDDADASTARTTLGLVIGTNVQAYDADLSTIAAANNGSVLAATTASYTTAEASKLAGIEALADVTDTTNVTAAGALMDSEVDADLKTLSLPANTTISTFGASLVDDADASTARTTLGVVIGTDVQAYDADTLKADTADTLTAGFDSSDYAAGTKSTGTYTPNPAQGNFQVATNGGAHTLAPPSTSCSIVVHYTNNGSAGTITTSGFTAVTGDSFTTTDTHEFVCVVTKINDVSVLNVTALQ